MSKYLLSIGKISDRNYLHIYYLLFIIHVIIYIIVSMAGCHEFHDGHRMLFRGVQTMPAQTGLSKQHMTSIPWKYIPPDQLKWAGSSETQPAYICLLYTSDAADE